VQAASQWSPSATPSTPSALAKWHNKDLLLLTTSVSRFRGVLAGIPVVVVSAADRAACLRASGHVQKPFQPEELLAAIRGLS
jgi:DNA-binding response OmpR family regulator